MLLSAIAPAVTMSVPRRRRGKSVDTGGLALALSDQSQGLGHGWGGWEETETGETRYAEVLIDVRAHTEGMVNPTYDNVPSPSVSSFPVSLPTSPNPSTLSHSSPSPSFHDPHNNITEPVGLGDLPTLKHTLPEEVNSGDDSSRRYMNYPQPFHLLAHDSNRRRLILSLSSWNFEPHKLSSDEVLSCALLLFEAFMRGAPDGIVSGICLDQLPPFLNHLQTIYRQTNSYHNFEHALDVFQALYHFLSEAGVVHGVHTLLTCNDSDGPDISVPRQQSPSVLDVLTREDIFALCIAAVGHDAGHPGLTNAFMKNAQTPLSVLYDDKSVLEQLHYTLIIQVMRHAGLGAILDGLSVTHSGTTGTFGCKKLLLSTILATDLSVHDQFMRDFAEVVDRGVDSADPFKAKVMACQALIKCADISNPARPYTVSQHWAAALSSEWSSQVVLEKHLHLPPSVYPSVDALGEAKGQVFFIERFAGPLFDLIGRGIPQLQKFSSQCVENLSIWKERLESFSTVDKQSSDHLSVMDPHITATHLAFVSRVASPEHFLSAFPPALPKSFVSPASSSSATSDTDEDTFLPIHALSTHSRHASLRGAQGITEVSPPVEEVPGVQDEDDRDSISGSSAYETCESSPPASPLFTSDRLGPPKLEITTSAPSKHPHSPSNPHAHKRRISSISSPTYLVSPSNSHHHRAPSMSSNHSTTTNMTSASVSANATAAIRAAYKASVRKKPSARSFHRSSWNPPPAEYRSFVAGPLSSQPSSIPSPSLPPVVFTVPGFTGPSADEKDHGPAASALLMAARFSAENLSPLTPESSTTASSNISPLTPESSSSTAPSDPSQSIHTFGMAPVFHRIP